ncbi:MAG: MotA/TolQ/ExbB proton channel family protein [Pirellulaceae bacterium]
MRRSSSYRIVFTYSLMLVLGLYAVGSWAQENTAPSGTPPGDASGLTLDESPSPPAEEEPETTQRKSLLDTLRDGGPVGLLIGLLSLVAIGFIVEHFMTIRKSVLMPEDVAFELEEMIQQGRIDEALQSCQHPANQSLLAYVVEAGLTRFKGSEFGFAEYKAAVEEAGEDQTAKLYRKTEVLGLIGSIAPMLGLTGTVLGMIKAFNTISITGGNPKPDELAGSIGEALVTTLLGLVVAIPAMVAFSYFGNRIDSIVAETGKRVEQILMPLGRRR